MTSLQQAEKESTKGWNWGSYELLEEEMEFKVDGQRAFALRYEKIEVSKANGKNEVSVEFGQEESKIAGEVLCEMRFHVPNTELEMWQAEQK